MRWLEIGSETVAATTLMTGFSYLVGKSFSKLFSEPALINYVIRLSHIKINPKLNSLLGWLLHYIIGLPFVLCYHLIWYNGWLQESVISALILGALSGIIGILGWIIIFRLPRENPKVAFGEYYLQLFFAHIVFAFTSFAVHVIW